MTKWEVVVMVGFGYGCVKFLLDCLAWILS